MTTLLICNFLLVIGNLMATNYRDKIKKSTNFRVNVKIINLLFRLRHLLRIKYKQYPYAEDYQFGIDIAKSGGQFWTLPKELIQYRVSESRISNKHEQCETELKIKNELFEYLIQEKYFPDNTIIDIVNNLAQYNNQGYVNANTIFLLYQEILLTHNLLKNHNQQ